MTQSAPRSIDQYLAQLRAALAGEDAALIQDALYDAEEYLRAEVAAHPDKAEPDVLELIASTYGDPEEVAAAYRDTETARRTFDALSAAAQRCGTGSYGALLIGELKSDPQSLRIRPGNCGRDYRLKGSVLIEVTFCGLPDSVSEIVMTNIAKRIPG